MAANPSAGGDSLVAGPAQRLWQLWRQGQQPDVLDFLARAAEPTPAEVAAALLVDQRERWRLGDRRLAEAYLELFPRLRGDFEYALELIYGEYLLRLEVGEPADRAEQELARRFPPFAERLALQAQLHRALGAVGHTSQSGLSTGPGSATPPGLQAQDSTAWPSPPGYTITGHLGQGGMGVVYRAVDVARQRTVALKTLKCLDPAALYRLKQEFRALAEASHPNLVHFHELLSDGRQWFLSMELVEGANFLDHVRPAAASPPAPTADPLAAAAMDEAATTHHVNGADLPRLRAALGQLATGVAALHEMGKLHRDVKPTNVLVRPGGQVVLLDFGLAGELDRSGQHLSGEGHFAGTVAYVSPEQAAGQALTPASDWYSVGVVLYQALTGRLPFGGRDALRILHDKQTADADPPRAVAAGVPDDLDQLCADLLRRSPQGRPSGPEVLRRLGAGQAGSAPAASAAASQRAPFVGRTQHLATLREAFETSKRGRAVTALVQGRSGAGKSHLVLHFLAGLTERGEAVVLAGKCYERESVPYKALDGLVDSLSQHLARLPSLEAQALLPRDVHLLARTFPVLQRVPAVAQAPGQRGEVADLREARRRTFAALHELLGRLSDRRPLVLFIDDLQWGDADSAAQLAELLRPDVAPALLFVGCSRSEDAAASACSKLILGEKQPAGERWDLVVEPLTPAEARELALALMGRDDPAGVARAEAVARESAGNPFFVQVLVQRLAAGLTSPGCLPDEAGALGLEQLLWERLQALPEDARQLLEVVAVSGQPLSRAEACQAAGLAGQDPKALAVLQANRLLRGTGLAALEEVETYHDRVREAILLHLPSATRKGHHLRLAEALEHSTSAQAGVEPDGGAAEHGRHPAARRVFDLAYHFDAAGESVRAFPHALAAAERARSQHALQMAEQQLRIALRGASDGQSRCQVALGLGDVLMLLGEYGEAERQFQAAAEVAQEDLSRAQIASKLGELALKRGDHAAANKAACGGLALLGKSPPRRRSLLYVGLLWEALVQTLHSYFPRWFLARRKREGADRELTEVRLLHTLSHAWWFMRGPIPCLWVHLREMNLAERYPPSVELADVYAAHCPVVSMLPNFRRGFDYVERSMAIRRDLGDALTLGQSLQFYSMLLHAASRFPECVEKAREAIKHLEQTGDRWACNCARFSMAQSLHRLGDFRAALSEARRTHQDASAIGDGVFSAFSLAVWAKASKGKTPPDLLQAELESAGGNLLRKIQVLFAQAVCLIESDEPGGAADLLAEAQRLASKAGIRNTYVSPFLPWLATALRLAADKPDCLPAQRKALLRRAQVAARQGLRLARSFQNDLPHALRENARLAALRGDSRRAGKFLDESLAVAGRQGARYEHAHSLLAQGEIGSKFGWPGAAERLETARQVLHRLESPTPPPPTEETAGGDRRDGVLPIPTGPSA
jgi:serine/threonine protein kinase/tetratricopeptide (TPR) repeat protein